MTAAARRPRRAVVRGAAPAPLLHLVWLVAVACGGSAPRAEAPRAEDTPPPVTPETQGTLRRDALVRVLDAGLPAFLAGVALEPVTDEAGAFVGFRVLALYPGDPRLADAPVHVGDVVAAVNGVSVERPEDAHRAWEGLRVASELVVSLLRDGAPHEVRLAILD